MMIAFSSTNLSYSDAQSTLILLIDRSLEYSAFLSAVYKKL